MTDRANTVSDEGSPAVNLQAIAKQARLASRIMATTPPAQKNKVLQSLAALLFERRQELLHANEMDVVRGQGLGLSDALMDRLVINEARLNAMVAGIEQVAQLPDPVGCIRDFAPQPSGLRIGRMRVPLGVVGIIYESRPNVTIDAAILCIKSGNAAILRGGSEAISTNMALAQCIQMSLQAVGLPITAVQLLPSTDRALVGAMMNMVGGIDVIIPRGGRSLTERVAKEARVPVIKHLDGVCHLYVSEFADLPMATEVVINAKTYRYGICGALETLLVSEKVATKWLPEVAGRFNDLGVTLRGCPIAQALIGAEPATEEDWHKEYLAPILAVRVVTGLDEAIEHIEHYGSHHTDGILTQQLLESQRFVTEVDSSSVMVNAPTCFADGFEYGLGAEIGISTDKLHARGPVGLEGLTTEKYIVMGDGQLRGKNA